MPILQAVVTIGHGPRMRAAIVSAGSVFAAAAEALAWIAANYTDPPEWGDDEVMAVRVSGAEYRVRVGRVRAWARANGPSP